MMRSVPGSARQKEVVTMKIAYKLFLPCVLAGSTGELLGQVTRPKDAKVGPANVTVAKPQLGAAIFSPSTPAPSIGGSDITVYDPAPAVTLAWKSQVPAPAWVWQVADRAFAAGNASLAPDGLLKSGPVSGSSFLVKFREFPPLGSSSGQRVAQQATMPRGTMHYHIRILPVQGTKVMGAPSNTVVVHYTPGARPPNTAGDAMAGAAAADSLKKTNAAALAAAYAAFKVELVSFTPAVFPEPSRWGCIYLEANPNYQKLAHPLAAYEPGREHCPKPYSGASYQASGLWDYVGGWAKAYEGLVGFYDGTKSWVGSKIAAAVPCNLLPKAAAQDCMTAAKYMADAALSAGLVAAGVPPSLPSLGTLKNAAKGEISKAAVDFTCQGVQSQGGACTPEMRSALDYAFKEGLNQLEKSVKTAAVEPGCDNPSEAHANGREPLPCFTNYPGVIAKPAKGVMYDPPNAVVRVTRIKASPNTGAAACHVNLTMLVTNHYSGGVISGLNVKPADLQGNPYASVTSGVPALGIGQSVNVTLVMSNLTPYVIPGHLVKASPGWSKDWLALYNGGNATVTAGLITVDPGTKQAVSCASSSAQKTLTLHS
jgi:hypothetical protein